MAAAIPKEAHQRRRILIAAEVQRRRVGAMLVMKHLSYERNNKRNRIGWKRPWLYNHDEQGIFPNLVREMEIADESSFSNFLRMSPEHFKDLVSRLGHLIRRQDTNFHKAIPPQERLAVTLRFLATGESFKSLSYSFRLGATTIGQIIPETCQAIYEVLKEDYLKMPQVPEDWLKIANDFQERWNFPNTLGAIDGKHISVQAPPHSGSVFYNYKHFFSIVLMALVDADYQFIYVDVGCNGRISDGGVFAGSNLKSALDRRLANIPGKSPLPGDSTQEMSYHMLADDAFPLREDLMKPFPFRNMCEEQRIFNYRLSRARRVVENAFGIMAAKFRVFLSRIILAPEKAESAVLAACALHNYLRSTRDAAYIEPGTLDDEDEGHHLIHGSWRATYSSLQSVKLSHSNFDRIEPKEKRQRLMEYFSSSAGSVPWQNAMI